MGVMLADSGTETLHQEKVHQVLAATDQEVLVINSKQTVSAVLEMIADFPTTLTNKVEVTVDSEAVVITTTEEVTTLEEDITQAQKFATNSEIQEAVTLVTTANSAMMSVTKVEIIKLL